MADVDITMRGPLFDGRAQAAIHGITVECREQIGAQAWADTRMWMNHFFRHPTPYYETQVIVENRADTTVVTDQGVVYGPWLAGQGSRNQTSRFKGYAHWRLAVQGAQARAPEIVTAVFERRAGELG